MSKRKQRKCVGCPSMKADYSGPRCRVCHVKNLKATCPDYAYRNWLHGGGSFVDTARLADLLPGDRFVGRGAVVREAGTSGVNERTLRRVVSRASSVTDVGVAIVLANAYGFEPFWDLSGKDGWSGLGRFCGDGSPVTLTGCGTMFHSHFSRGLCEECHDREVLGCGPMEPRDVRLAVTR